MYSTRNAGITLLTSNASRLKDSIDEMENGGITGFYGIAMLALVMSILLQVKKFP